MEMQNTNFKLNPTDFRLLLQQELIERCRKNSKYSLRAFAKSLGIGPSALSDMLNNKRAITPASIERLGLAMGLELSEVQKFTQKGKLKEKSDYQQLTIDTFSIISDWYHYAILELMKVKGFKNDLSWIAKTLNISKTEANSAFERLSRVGLIKIDKNGKWQDTSGGYTTNIESSILTSAAHKKLQKQVLELSIKALESLPTDIRNHTTMTVSVNPKKLPIAIKKIKEFRRGLSEFFESDKEVSEVYQLAISLFPVSNLNQKGDL